MNDEPVKYKTAEPDLKNVHRINWAELEFFEVIMLLLFNTEMWLQLFRDVEDLELSIYDLGLIRAFKDALMRCCKACVDDKTVESNVEHVVVAFNAYIMSERFKEIVASVKEVTREKPACDKKEYTNMNDIRAETLVKLKKDIMDVDESAYATELSSALSGCLARCCFACILDSKCQAKFIRVLENIVPCLKDYVEGWHEVLKMQQAFDAYQVSSRKQEGNDEA